MTAEQLKQKRSEPATVGMVCSFQAIQCFITLIVMVWGLGVGVADKAMPLRDQVRDTKAATDTNTADIKTLRQAWEQHIQDENKWRMDQAQRERDTAVIIAKMANQIDNMSDYYKRAQRQ
jgi:hypothetical protein